jgi:6,7-dimethyl-8-ribityllumazine synthase
MARVFEGGYDATGLRFAVVVSRFNTLISERLLEGALRTLVECGAADDAVDVFWVPGAFEIPLIARTAAQSERYDAVICLGAVIQGETDHYRLVADQAAYGIAAVASDTGVPCIFEVLATSTTALAIARAGGTVGNKGDDAARAAIEMVRVLAHARKPRAGEGSAS